MKNTNSIIFLLILIGSTFSYSCFAQATGPSVDFGKFEIIDTAQIIKGEIHTIITNTAKGNAILIDGLDIQALNLKNSKFAGSNLFIQNIGGDLELGNEKGITTINGETKVEQIQYGGNGIQSHASSEIGFGNISKGLFSPVINSGTDNYEITWNNTTKEYEIVFDDYTYNEEDYTTMVTPRGTTVDKFRANGTADKLLITFFDSSDNRIKTSFQFVTYRFVPSSNDTIIVTRGDEDSTVTKR